MLMKSNIFILILFRSVTKMPLLINGKSLIRSSIPVLQKGKEDLRSTPVHTMGINSMNVFSPNAFKKHQRPPGVRLMFGHYPTKVMPRTMQVWGSSLPTMH